MTRNVSSFEAGELVPESALLDTSFVVEALVPTQPLHDSALDYLIQLAENGSSVTFSELLELELAEASFLIALKERHPRDWRRRRFDGRARPRAARLMSEVSRAWGQVLGYLRYERVAISDVLSDVPSLMANFGLASYDAVHAATALRRDRAATIVTTDVAFATLPADAVAIVTNLSRLRRCREIRSRR